MHMAHGMSMFIGIFKLLIQICTTYARIMSVYICILINK